MYEPAGFAWRKLTDLARMESGHTPSRSKKQYWGGDIPWIGIRDATVSHGRVIDDTKEHCTQEGLDNSSARLLPAGTVCLSRTASVGYVVAMGRPMATSQDFVNWVCGPELNPNYLRYVLTLEQESVRRFAHGTTHQTMYYPEAKALYVLLPSRDDQNAIAAVLGALDDKIAANECLATLVDELLAATFTSVAASKDTAALSSIAQVNVATTKPILGATLRYLDISSVRRGGYEYPEESPWEDAPGRARRVINKFDTVWSTVRPNRRSHALVLDDDPLLVASTGLAVLTPNERRSAGLYEASRTPEFESFLLSVAEGSAYPAVRADRFAEAPIPALSDAEWDEFEAFALPTRERAHSAQVESRRLASTREELLPLLMSGKVRIKEVEGVV